MPKFTYLTLDLLIEKNGDAFRARIVNSPVGQASANFASPFDASELEMFLARVGRRAPIVGTSIKPEEWLKQFGSRLFDAAFHDETLSSFRRSRDAAERERKGLRVKLRLNDVPELGDLPWEYLYDASRQNFLALSKDTPIVRFIELPERVEPLAAPAPLNLLAVLASPKDFPALDVETEWQRMNDATRELRAQNKITLTRVTPPTLDALHTQFRKKDYHIFHFVGHGDYDAARQRGALIFQDEQGAGYAVSDEQIATLLHDANSLRVALLNACEGGRASAQNPFAGVAPRLVQQGIPAVIAMQFPITDNAAVKFSSDVYATIADGFPIDAAVNEARRAIYFGGSVLEWGTPVLFMRAEDGMIFEKEEEMRDEKRDSPQNDLTRNEKPRGGINISGGNIHVGGDVVSGDKIVQGNDVHVVNNSNVTNVTGNNNVVGNNNTVGSNVVNVGAGANVGQVAAGNHITQTMGKPTEEPNELAQKLAEVTRALQDARANLDASKIALAEFQLQLLQNELTKRDAAPSGSAITTAADGLLASVPMIGGPLGAVFQTAAAQKILQQTNTSDWAARRFKP